MDRILTRLFPCLSKKKTKERFRVTRVTRHIDSPETAEKYFRKIWDKELLTKQEQVYVLFVDEKNMLIDHKLMHTGGVCQTVIDLRVLLSIALEYKADGIFIAHNHPKSGLKPSEVDIRMTDKIIDGCKMLNIKLWDHIILTSKGYYSFAESGLLD